MGQFRAGSSMTNPIRVSFSNRNNVEMDLDGIASQYAKSSFAQSKAYPIYSVFNPDGDLVEITNLEATHSFTDFHLKTRTSAISDLFDQFDELPELPEVFGKYPEWNRCRPYLTGFHVTRRVDQSPSKEAVVADQDLLDDLLFVFMGLNGQFIGPQFKSRPNGRREMKFEIRVKVEASSQALLQRMLPLCESILIILRFVELRSGLEFGTVCHAISAAIQSILDDWFLLVTQLEGQLLEGKLTFQKLWFYVQPAMSVLSVLAEICQKTAIHDLRGTELLNLLHLQILQFSGSQNSQALLQKLLEAGCVPYFQVLEKWLCEGILNDPFSEFMIEEDKEVQIMNTTSDLQSAYWLNRYKVRKTYLLLAETKELASIQSVPHFLRTSTDLILKTGKYLNAIKECGRNVKRPLDVEEHLVFEIGGSGVYHSLIQKAHQVASQAFLDLFIKDLSLVEWLRGLKHFFLMDRGDMIGHLMDIAREELDKTASQVVVNRVQSLLELASKTSSIPAEANIESLRVELDHRSLVDLSVCLKQPQVKRNQHRSSVRSSVQRSSFLPARVSEIAATNRASNLAEELSGWDIFMINYKVDWPMMLIAPPKLMQMYQLFFKQLFSLKRAEFELSKAWKILQKTRKIIDRRLSGGLRLFHATCYQMHYTVQQYLRYLSVHSIEPRWQAMEAALLKAKDIDNVIETHTTFVEKVLWQSLLRRVKSVKELDHVINLSLMFAQFVVTCLDLEVTGEEMNVLMSGLGTKPSPSEIISERNRLLNLKIEAALAGNGVEERILKIRTDYCAKLNALVNTLLDYCDMEAGDRSSKSGTDELQSREDLDKLISLAETIRP